MLRKKRKLHKDSDVSEMDDNEFLDMLKQFNEMQDKHKYHCMVCSGLAVQSAHKSYWVECIECNCTYPIQ